MSLKQRRFGIELELSRKLLCINNSDRSYSQHWRGVENILYSLHEDGEISRGWRLKVDTSCGGEVVSPILCGSDGLRQAAIVCHRIQKYANQNSLPAVDAECGLHIHLDANDMKPRQLSNLFVLLHHAEPIIYSMYPNRSAEYCAPIEVNMKLASKFRDWTDVRDTWYRGENNTKNRRQTYSSKFINGSTAGEYYDGTRYHGFNIHCFWRQGTVEFRYGMGTLDPIHIKAYYEMCLSMVNTSMTTKKVKFSQSMAELDFKELMNHYSLNYRFRRVIRQLCKECSFSRGTIKLIMDMIRKNRPWLLDKRPMDGNVITIDWNNLNSYIFKTKDKKYIAANGAELKGGNLRALLKAKIKVVDVIIDYSNMTGNRAPLVSVNPRYQFGVVISHIVRGKKLYKKGTLSPYDYASAIEPAFINPNNQVSVSLNDAMQTTASVAGPEAAWNDVSAHVDNWSVEMTDTLTNAPVEPLIQGQAAAAPIETMDDNVISESVEQNQPLAWDDDASVSENINVLQELLDEMDEAIGPPAPMINDSDGTVF